MSRRTRGIFGGLIGGLAILVCGVALGEERANLIDVDEQQIPCDEAIRMLSEENGLPIQWSGDGKQTFDMKIAEPTFPRIIARLCEQMPAACQEGIAGPKIYLQAAKRPPLVRKDLEDGSVFLLRSWSQTREVFGSGKARRNILLQGTLLTDPKQDTFGVGTFEVDRVKGATDWRDIDPNDGNLQTLDNQLQWSTYTRLTLPPDDSEPVTAVEGSVRVSIVKERAELVVNNPADPGDDVVSPAITCTRGRVDPNAKELAVLTFHGPAVDKVKRKLNHERGWRFITVSDDAGRITDVDLDAEFQQAGLVVRVKSDRPRAIKSVKISLPTKFETKKLPMTIDPLPR